MITTFTTREDERLWDWLVAHFDRRYGRSGISTFWGARSKGYSFADCMLLMKHQIAWLGVDYPGGLECTIYRGIRIPETLAKIKSEQ